MTTRTNDETFTASFVFYYSFTDMISKIPDREIRLQAYEMLFDYAMFGVEPQEAHWAVDMVFSAVKPQIDANNKRRANGKKGGRKPAQEAAAKAQTEAEVQTEAPMQAQPVIQAEATAQAQQPQTEVQAQAEAQAQAAAPPAVQTVQAEPAVQALSAVQPQQAIQAEPVVQAEPAMQEQPTRQVQSAVKPTPRAQTAQDDHLPGLSDQIVYFGENQYPTTPTELGRFEEFAYRLFRQYDGSKPNLADIERVMERTYTRMERPDGEAIAAFDRNKADLLEYAFEQAREAGKLNWPYVDGMYRKFAMRDRTCSFSL